VGVRSGRWGEEVTAFIVTSQGREVDDENLMVHTRQRLSAYKCPKRFLKVEQLPRNEMGKVLKEELIQAAEEERPAGG
jgi:acyl-CoA synthetase (AMP-forming)/AMP-acid ligase II